MAKMIRFFTDPHLGKVLVSNTTPESRRRHTDFLRLNARKVASEGVNTVCVGDLFDKYDNPAHVVCSALDVASDCSVILGGNHDVENSATAIGSFDLLKKVFDESHEMGPDMVAPRYGQVHVEQHEFPECFIVSVPHHSTQDLFLAALDAACERVPCTKYESEYVKVLILHCNYDVDIATTDSSLNLTRVRAAELIKHFDYVMIGHDHNSKEDFDGKVIVMGSISPTSFGDCHVDHCYYDLDMINWTMEKKVQWSADRYLECGIEAFLCNDSEGMAQNYDFIRVSGSLTPEQAPLLSKHVKKVWKNETGAPFAIRVDATVTAAKQGEIDASAEMTMSFREKLASRLQESPDLLEVWEAVTTELEGDDQ